ncbi:MULTISPECIES: hypothetical protein [Streptomyces]|uniref:Uncharacterized protein n=1 Tax=Streptomyces chilikensis TaxID=1194079 RepID=A0ABV3EVF6_9ACTN|nr:MULTISPECIES: hypothetical protein [Streptomyces]MDH6225956.1 hypothetical protein [Streptomyces sp. MJP52]
MRIPGFTAESALHRTGGAYPSPEAPYRAGPDRIVPQGLCEIELRPVCRMQCRRSPDPQRCVANCLQALCSDGEGF